ncbi:Protein of unknown function [Pyronema omphalodes CBS 100304]|uniref:Uncharacterized protein n=1 Tax=Pyronema omphalodes (strain CBS 100304) TaxID=1076935 RepID=U4LE91_PYROM|nr:Protein of unknown function [Pyronema omphalodes CBS 100304]
MDGSKSKSLTYSAKAETERDRDPDARLRRGGHAHLLVPARLPNTRAGSPCIPTTADIMQKMGWNSQTRWECFNQREQKLETARFSKKFPQFFKAWCQENFSVAQLYLRDALFDWQHPNNINAPKLYAGDAIDLDDDPEIGDDWFPRPNTTLRVISANIVPLIVGNGIKRKRGEE